MPNTSRIETLISVAFEPKHVRSCLAHFAEVSGEFKISDWEKSIVRAGKFVEATLKALALHTSYTLPPPRKFSAGQIVTHLKGLSVGTFSDAIRITIPRACEFVYDIASNRGARHDPDEVDSNELDATAVLATVSWILSELLRYSQKRQMTQDETKELIAGLVHRRYPAVETVDGRAYFHIPKLSARQAAILALWERHPVRMTRDELKEAVVRNNFSPGAAKIGISRMANFVDEDEHGKWRLLQPGIAEAEALLETNPGSQ
jgi:hypothetical protein